MPTDPLTAAAELMAPAPAGRSFFDPTDAGNIISRYARSNRDLAFARDQFKDQADMEELGIRREINDRNRQLFDRETVDFEENQDFKKTRGALLESLASLDENADDFEQQVGDFLSTAPDVAAKDDAVQAILKLKQDRFQGKQMERRDREIEDRRRREAQRDEAFRVRSVMAEAGFDTQPFTNPDTDDFDTVAALRAYGQGNREKDLRKERLKQIEDQDKEDASYFSKDPATLDAVREMNPDKVNSLFETRVKDITEIPEDLVRSKIVTDTEEAFVNRVKQPILDKYKGDLQTDPKVIERTLEAVEAKARSAYSAARGVSMLSRVRDENAPPKPKASNPWLEGALKRTSGD